MQEVKGIEVLINGEVEIFEGLYIQQGDQEPNQLTIAFTDQIKGKKILETGKKEEIKILNVIEELSKLKSRPDQVIKPMLLGDFNHDSYIDIEDFVSFKSKYKETEDYSAAY